MAIYAVHNSEPKFIFIINYKVMYSSLYEMLPKYFPEVKFYHKKQVKYFRFSNYRKFAIVRNPYSRVVSTFFDKCIRAPEDGLKQKKTQLQYCQHQLLKAIGIIRDEKFEISTPAKLYSIDENSDHRFLLNNNFELLKTISFDEYVQCMAILLKEKNTDGHFEVQYKVFNIPGQNPFYNKNKIFKNSAIIKLENIEQEWNGTICSHLGKSMELKKVNKTDHLRDDFNQYYNEKTQETIARLYRIDFTKFNYPEC